MMKKVALIAAMALAGCATSPVPIEQAQIAPQNKLLAYQNKSAVNNSTIIVVRDSGLFGVGCALAVYVDGKKSAFLDAGEKAVFYVPAGIHNVGVGSSENGLCSGMVIRNLSATTIPGVPQNFRISMDGSGLYFTPYFINEGEF